MRWSVALAIVLVAAPAHAWSQFAGDAGRTGSVDLPEGPWDVTALYDILPDDEAFFAIVPGHVVPTPYGPTGVARNLATDACTIVRIVDVDAGTVQRTPLDATGCWTAGYSPEYDLFFVCRADEIYESDLRAFDGRTLREVWRVTAADVGLVEALARDTGNPPGDPLLASDAVAGCTGPAVDRDRMIAPWLATRMGLDLFSHRIASIALADGTVQWSTTIPAWLEHNQGSSPPSCQQDERACADGTSNNWAPLMATRTSNGIVVAGVGFCPDIPSCDDPLFVGTLAPIRIGAGWIREIEDPARPLPAGFLWGGGIGDGARSASNGGAACLCRGDSIWATSVGTVGHIVLGLQQREIDPDRGVLREFPVDDPGARFGHFAWSGLQPTKQGLIFMDGGRMTSYGSVAGNIQWTYSSFGDDWTFASFDRGLTTSGQLLVPAHGLGQTTEEPPLFEVHDDLPVRHLFIDPTNGQLDQLLPGTGEWLAVDEPALGTDLFSLPFWWFSMPSLVPLDDGFLRVYAGGHTHRIALASEAPTWTMTSLYPDVDETVAIRLERALNPSAKQVIVNWGSGSTEPMEWVGDGRPFVASHRYPPGTSEANFLVTVVDAAGLSKTGGASVHIGGRPPAGLPDRLPAPAVSNMYPPPGVPVNVTLVRPAGDVVELVVDWDDGLVQRMPWNASTLELSHIYNARGERDPTFTAVFLDGTTATRTLQLDVGGEPPAPLTWMQKQFSPENQEVTFFVLGLIITTFGAIVAALSRVRSRYRIRGHLNRLDRIRVKSINDPEGALRDLGRLRGELQLRLLKGRMTEGQVQLLEDRIRTIVGKVQAHVLEPMVGRVSPQLLSLAALSLKDNRLEPSEHATLLAALQTERELSDVDRKRFMGLINAARDIADTGS